jgi:hypothetical protein
MNTIIIITKFLYEYILTRFGCPLTLVTNQGVHFINDVIKYPIDHFFLSMLVFPPIIHREMGRQSQLTSSLSIS